MEASNDRVRDCYDWFAGKCTKKWGCPFRHSQAAKRTQQICLDNIRPDDPTTHGCYNLHCPLRHPPVNFRTEYCKYFKSGCDRGDNCMFSHETDQPDGTRQEFAAPQATSSRSSSSSSSSSPPESRQEGQLVSYAEALQHALKGCDSAVGTRAGNQKNPTGRITNEAKSVPEKSPSTSSNLIKTPPEFTTPNKMTWLLLGEEGSGKSTVVNYLANYCANGSLEDLKVAVPTKYLKANCHSENGQLTSKKEAKNEASQCSAYAFQKDGQTIEIIDTPGLKEVSATEYDPKNLDIILDVAQKSPLSAIIIVINGSNARSCNIQRVVDRLRGLVPDVVLNNTVVLFTNCYSHTRNFDVKSLGGLTSSKYFHMQNSAFSTDPKSWERAAKRHLTLEWEDSMDTLREITTSLQQRRFKTNISQLGNIIQQLALDAQGLRSKRITNIINVLKYHCDSLSDEEQSDDDQEDLD